MVASNAQFRVDGEVMPLVYGALSKAVPTGGLYVPKRALGGWLMTYGKIGLDGKVIRTRDREGHVMVAAKQLGSVDVRPYVESGLWNDTHLVNGATSKKMMVGVPSVIEFHDGTTPLSKAHRKVGYWTAGHLYDRAEPDSWRLYGDYVPTPVDLDRADYLWAHAQMFKGTPRTLGFSAEGEMYEAEGEILWARLTGAAVCVVPQNPDTTAEVLAKAVHAGSMGSVVPEDLEGVQVGVSLKEKVRRLIAVLVETYKLEPAVAAQWVRAYFLETPKCPT